MQTVRIDIEQTMSAIEKTKDTMVDLFGQGKVIQCESYELPLVTKEQENERPEFILVQQNSDINNASSLMREVSRWYARADTYDNHLSTKASQRIPGFIQLQMNDDLYREFALVVKHLNELKKTFRNHVTTIKKADERFQILHDMYPMLVTTNLYRKVKVFRNSEDVSFFWATNKRRIEKVDFDRLKERLENSQKQPNNLSIDPQVWYEKVKEELELLDDVTNKDSLRTVREVKAQPMVNVDGLPTSCPMPIILATSSDLPIEVESLGNFDKNSQRQGTGRKAKVYVPIIPRLSLFQSC